ncbi:2-C-methyl-D-erythritol 2,4-cyclodiphosphate synthase [Malacoplasma penetrans]|nr:2-C-methyl-D-erythritol 2,4-cyclodiphosphate synthase [Malacoplasma penetrans]RXY96865.1 2-C-methyl-D-erythritol 2,4-cyclodiphosphate synthase [Malacoplasma penetrans]
MKYKIGNGIDIHKIKKEKCKQRLAGLDFELDYKIIAHSDGDIILHSISSAILGALSLQDLGTYFSDTDSKNKNLDSLEILSMCLNELKKQDYSISNVDITIICEYIIFKDIKDQIKSNLEKLLNNTEISLKATRYEEDKNMIQVNTVLLINK